MVQDYHRVPGPLRASPPPLLAPVGGNPRRYPERQIHAPSSPETPRSLRTLASVAAADPRTTNRRKAERSRFGGVYRLSVRGANARRYPSAPSAPRRNS